MPDIDELQVIISYKQLCEILQAVSEIPQLRRDLKRNYEQLTALKGLYSDLLSRVHDLMKLL